MSKKVIATLKEIKDNENRVALTPRGVHELVGFGHRVIVQKGAGIGAGFSDEEYVSKGAEISSDPVKIVQQADIVVKVKEPLPSEYSLLEKMAGKTLYTYFHLSAADKVLTEMLIKHRITAVAYETVEDKNGLLPLLKPMSEIAGVLAVQYGAEYLQKKYGGRAMTLGTISGAESARVVVVGGGVVGATAARTAAGMGAKVTLFEIRSERIAELKKEFKKVLGRHLFSNMKILKPSFAYFGRAIERCSLLVGAVLVKGARAPQVVTEKQVKAMRDGAVIVDVAIDQGGCIWGSKTTSHSHPIYDIEGKIYCCVPNMPGQVARQATQALTTATLPYLLQMANDGVLESMRGNARFAQGLNTHGGHVTYKSVADDLGLSQHYVNLEEVLSR